MKSVLEEAVGQFPKSAALWIKLVKVVLEGKEEAPLFLIDTGSDPVTEDPQPDGSQPAEVPSLFWRAAEALGATADAIPLWETAVDHFIRNVDAAEELFRRALAIEPPICNHFKARYLSWIAANRGKHAHQQFNKTDLIDALLIKVSLRLDVSTKPSHLCHHSSWNSTTAW